MSHVRRVPIRFSTAVATTLLLSAGQPAMAGHTHSLSGDPTAPWAIHVQLMDDALKTRSVTAALRAWHDAYLSALGSRQWQGMIEVGDAYLRIGEVAGSPQAAQPRAREAYLTALFRARRQGSLEGALRTAEAFALLGDGEAAEQCLRVAERLAARDPNPEARDRVRTLAAWLADRSLSAGSDSPGAP